jgi:hypothetical protein
MSPGMSFDPRTLLSDPLGLVLRLVRESLSLRQLLLRMILVSSGCVATVEPVELPAAPEVPGAVDAFARGL